MSSPRFWSYDDNVTCIFLLSYAFYMLYLHTNLDLIIITINVC